MSLEAKGRRSAYNLSQTPGGIRVLTDEEIDLIGASMYYNVPRQEYTEGLITNRNCFLGTQAVAYLVKLLKLHSRDDAVRIGQQVCQKGIFYQTNSQPFCDKNYFFVFNDQWENLLWKRHGATPNASQVNPTRAVPIEIPPQSILTEPDMSSEELLMSFDSFSAGSPYFDTEFNGDILSQDTSSKSIFLDNVFSQNQYSVNPTKSESFLFKPNPDEIVKSEFGIQPERVKMSRSLSSPDSDFEPAKKKRKTSKGPVSAEQKLEQRAEKSRNASRLYRQRKKQFIEELKQKLDEVNSEKSAILQNMQKQQQLLQKLAEENSKLKHDRVVDSNRLEGQRRELIKELITLTSKGASDSCLEPILIQLENLNQVISKLGTNHLEELISPTTVGSLVTSGFFKDRVPIVTTPNQGGMKDLIEKLRHFVTDLTPQQNGMIEQILKHHSIEIERWKQQRLKINEEIEGKLITKRKGDKFNPLQPVVLQDLMKLSNTLEQLRQTLDGEAKSWENAVQKILELLNVQQRCTFFLQCEYMHASLQQLKYLWASIYGPCL